MRGIEAEALVNRVVRRLPFRFGSRRRLLGVIVGGVALAIVIGASLAPAWWTRAVVVPADQISLGDLSVRVFYNPTGFGPPVTSSVLPNGTIVPAPVPYYALQIRSLTGGTLYSLQVDGPGYLLTLARPGADADLGIGYLSLTGPTIYPVMPTAWKAGDTVQVVLTVAVDDGIPAAQRTVLDMGSIIVEQTEQGTV